MNTRPTPKKPTLVLLLLLTLLCTSGQISKAGEVEIGTLVLNKTITRIGNSFYDAFTDRWYPPPQLGTMHIRISEAPSARWGSIISIWVDEQIYFRTRLSNRSNKIEEIAEQAVQQVMVSIARRIMRDKNQEEGGDLYGDGL